MPGESKKTTDHAAIKQWREKRDGVPATVRGTGEGADVGVLRIDFKRAEGKESSLTPIGWEEFFSKFDEKGLAFLYQDETSKGEESRFFKFVKR